MNIRTLLSCSAAGLLLAGVVQAQTPPEPAESMMAATAVPTPLSMPGQLADASVALTSLSNPPNDIATAKVVDDKGSIVGAVQKVELDAAGKPTNVEIALLGTDHIIAMNPQDLRYDTVNNVVIAEMDNSRIVEMPVKPQG